MVCSYYACLTSLMFTPVLYNEYCKWPSRLEYECVCKCMWSGVEKAASPY